MEEEEVGKGEEATVIGQAVLIRPKVREGSTAVAGVGICTTAGRRGALRAKRRRACMVKEEGAEASKVEEAGTARRINRQA